MLKTLLKSVRQYKKETLLSPLCVVVEVFIEVYIPYIMGFLPPLHTRLPLCTVYPIYHGVLESILNAVAMTKSISHISWGS